MDDQPRCGAELLVPSDAVPPFGERGLRPVKHPPAVDGREVHAPGAFPFAPLVMPVRAMKRVGAMEVLRPRHIGVNQVFGRDHHRGREFPGDGPCAGRCRCGLERVDSARRRASATRRDQCREDGLGAFEGHHPAARDAHFDPGSAALGCLARRVGLPERSAPWRVILGRRNGRVGCCGKHTGLDGLEIIHALVRVAFAGELNPVESLPIFAGGRHLAVRIDGVFRARLLAKERDGELEVVVEVDAVKAHWFVRSDTIFREEHQVGAEQPRAAILLELGGPTRG